jgi:ribosomal protein S18 acetylase RimI-like enzyme
MGLIRELALYEKAADQVLVSVDELREHAFGEKPYIEIVVAEHQGVVLGAALFYEKYSTWKGPALHLEDLIVAERHRGLGLGALLLDEVIRIGKARNYRRVYWQVLDWNAPAISFYEKYRAHFDAEWLNVHIELDNKQSLKA